MLHEMVTLVRQNGLCDMHNLCINVYVTIHSTHNTYTHTQHMQGCDCANNILGAIEHWEFFVYRVTKTHAPTPTHPHTHTHTHTHSLTPRSSPYSASEVAGVEVELEVAKQVTPPNTTDSESEEPTKPEYSSPEPLILRVIICSEM